VRAGTGARLAAACLTLSAAVACDGRPKVDASSKPQPRSGPANVVLDLSSGVPEEEAAGVLGIAPHKGSFSELVETLAELGTDKYLKGIFVRFGGARIGFARAQEIADGLEKLKASGKPIYCHADSYTNSSMYTALRSCTKLFVSPAGDVETIGLGAQVVYMHKLLAEQLHVSIDIMQVGRFKGAEEPLTRDGPSDEARASLEGVLASMREAWLQGAHEARPGVETALEDGPYSPERALALKMVDGIAYADDAQDEARKATGAVRDDVRFGHGSSEDGREGGMDELLHAFGGGGSPVALVRATGSISMGKGDSLSGSEGITERGMDRLLTRLTKDDDVRAVVLRIDSPGGSALASDLIWHRLMELRDKKPVVVSVGDMAASGGYFMACTGNVIFAEPGSIVGSIGVVGGKLAIGHLAESFGVHAETFSPAKQPTAAARASYPSLFDDWDDATKARVLETMTGVYELFLSRVAAGRKTTVDKISPYAEGRIWSGTQGKEHGLVDEIGGLGAAIAKARELAKLPADASVETVGSSSSFLERLVGAQASAPAVSAPAVSSLDPGKLAREVLEAMPGLSPFVDSLVPLLRGEHALTALPFALIVR
jgi:protease-4